jgi:hypothetical protein
MKALIKPLLLGLVATAIAACSSSQTSWTRLADSEIDQKSYAVGYGTAAQTYADRVNETYDINAFMNGVNDWYENRITLPVEQIQASVMNRMLDHNVYAYYSGALYAADLQGKFNYVDPNCWNLVQTKSISQGIHDAMLDLQKGQTRDDAYIKNGVDDLLHQCVNTVVADEAKAAPAKNVKKAKKAKSTKKAKK